MNLQRLADAAGIERRKAARDAWAGVYRVIRTCWTDALSARDRYVLELLCRIAADQEANGFILPIHHVCASRPSGLRQQKLSTGALKHALRWLKEVGLVAVRSTPAGTAFLIDFERLLAADNPLVDPDAALRGALLRPDAWG